ncbi:pimeloyl-ACP methyl ester carboxylesterase [Bacillus tianshenii]|uniref:Pimeloyl-ACP methyl ester carboxylesterase n=1 Tax=Sutcliffiella tianshenii TaxID=1463404 RepID=A0ABS2NXL0_9BACI|nr:alpha/beta hydrolase [Bacillus tianshenii]MBM7619406.1 pimeloyl-ACP methyl ester carboxylesterase [Bacillus tianshenii]
MAEYESTIHNDISLYYEDKGVGKPVVLLHGFCGTHAYWKYIMEELSSYYRVIAIDLRGHGKSAVSEEPFTIDDMAQDIAQLLEQLEIEKATVLGHSLGGYVTLALAENTPSVVEAFGLIHSTGAEDSAEAKEGRDKAIERINEEGMKGFIEELSVKLFAEENLEEMTNEVEFVKKLGFNTRVNGAQGALHAMKNRENREHIIKELNCPILLVAGKGDKIIQPEKTFITEGPHIHRTLMEKSGHMSMIEEPNELLDAIIGFLGYVDKHRRNNHN